MVTEDISSDIIDHCLKAEGKNRLVHVAYFYCNFGAERIQTLEYILGSLLKQLLSKHFDMASVPKSVIKIYERSKNLQTSMRILKPLLDIVCRSLERVHVIIDGLDEVSPETQSAFVELFDLSGHGHSFDVSLLVCSRPHIQGIQAAEKLQIAAREDDIKAMIRHRMKTDANIKRVVNGDTTWAGRVGAKIFRQSNGLPLLAQLHLNRIAEESSKADVDDKITALKPGLIEQYNQSLERITANPGFAKLAFRAFSWLIAARRPLSSDELCQALGIGLEDTKLRRDRTPAFESVLQSCLGLLRFNEPLKTVEFFHFSIKEHLVARNKPEETAALNVPQSCLDDGSLARRQQQYPLASYLAEHWMSHVHGDAEVELCDEIGRLLESPNIFSSLQLIPEIERNTRLIGTVKDVRCNSTPSKEMAFYLCTYFALVYVLKKTFDRTLSAAMSAPWGELYSPTHVAVCYGNVPMLQEILMHPHSANCRDRWGLTALHLAVRLRSTEEVALVRVLLESEPDLDLRDQDGDTPLHLAASYATVDSIELLLKAGAKVNIQNNRGKTPLHRAVERGSLRVTQLLLDHHADPTTVDGQGQSSLALSLQDQRLAFLDAIDHARDRDGNPYEFAAFERTALDGFYELDKDVVLLEKERTECQEREREEHERLHRSRYCGQTTTLRSALLWAAEKGDWGSISEMVRRGEDLNQRGRSGMTPIHRSISNGRVEATFWLADAGASLDIRDSDGRTPLDYAQGQWEILWELYHAGALRRPPSDSGWHPCRTTGTPGYRDEERMYRAKWSRRNHDGGPEQECRGWDSDDQAKRSLENSAVLIRPHIKPA
ncbi:hypothetical protein PV08_02344 [Exophiala spinifera]|uniref:Uncharacterized protein n=1 Tax=Exophiala spinifera TaxID=91928 RepID=A0A0D1ZZF2_9EURO|nr:uncharacterized protein PV08_02344 [Exophiala spinifera]KIW18057.1 hypothetical protein PV08_02344 [Exophiala spinifera]